MSHDKKKNNLKKLLAKGKAIGEVMSCLFDNPEAVAKEIGLTLTDDQVETIRGLPAKHLNRVVTMEREAQAESCLMA